MFIPKKSKITESLVEQVAIIEKIAEEFRGIVNDWSQLKEGASRLEILESEADKIVHTITDEIERIFILPFDKEDIKELTELIDDIADNLEQVANRLVIYRIPQSHQTLKDFSQIIFQSVQEIKQGVTMVKDYKISSKDYIACCKRIHSLENEGDKLHRRALENLMGEGASDFNTKDPVSIIKWKEILQNLEDTLDKCEDIAIILEKLKIKYR